MQLADAQEVRSVTLPPLEPGDHLTWPEFERRWEAMPHLKTAELIEGRVYMAAAVRFRHHGRPHANLMAWLGVYQIATEGVEITDNTTFRLDLDNAPQPDAALFLPQGWDGQVTITEEDYLDGAPELAVEVAASSASYDLGDKKTVYRRNGVQEYIVWQMFENQLDWFILEKGIYRSLQPNSEGILCSQVFPGLWLDREALLSGEMQRVMEVLQQGIQSDEYQQFLDTLQARRSSQA